MINALPPLSQGVSLRRWIEFKDTGAAGSEVLAGIDAIFRATAVRWPDTAEAAARFYDLWLGQYLRHEPELVWVALDQPVPSRARDVIGYIVGCRVDPALTLRFAALNYFQDFAPQTRLFPAHLHINLAASARGRGVGAHLVAALCAELTRDGIPGVHVVTGHGMRNVGFYERRGFTARARAARGGGEVLFLGRPLAGL